MLGNAMMLSVLALGLFALGVWSTVRIWRSSPLLAVLSFLFWPLTLLALVKYWGDERSDIRVPFFASLVLGVLGYIGFQQMTQQLVEAMAQQISAEELDALRRQDPDMAQAIDALRSAQGADVAAGVVDAATPDTAATPPRAVDPVQREAARRLELQQIAMHMSWRLGRVDLAPAPAVLRLPSEFRFATRDDLSRFARVRGTPLPDDVIGWVVHRDVSLARDDAWFVQVRHRRPGAMPPLPQAADDTATRALEHAAYVQRLATALDGVAAPVANAGWDEAGAIARWQRVPAEPAWPEAVAVRVLDTGLLEFSAAELHPVHAELGRRSVDLLVQRTLPAASARVAPR